MVVKSIRSVGAVVMTSRPKIHDSASPSFMPTLNLSDHADRIARWFSYSEYKSRIVLRPTRIRLNTEVMIMVSFLLCFLFSPSGVVAYYSLMPSISLAPTVASNTSESPTSAPTSTYYYYTASPNKLISSSIPTNSPLSTENPFKEQTSVPSETPSPSPIQTTNNPTVQAAQLTESPLSSALPTPNPTSNPTEPIVTESFNSVTPTKPPKILTPVPKETTLPISTNQPSEGFNTFTKTPTSNPSDNPIPNPQLIPTDDPTAQNAIPTLSPSEDSLFETETLSPSPFLSTNNPSEKSSLPSAEPTRSNIESFKTVLPTKPPSPTRNPFKQPKFSTIISPSPQPINPTSNPSDQPLKPKPSPSQTLTEPPTISQTTVPTEKPLNTKPNSSTVKTEQPTQKPQATLSSNPTVQPSSSPTKGPTEKPLNPKPISSPVKRDQATQSPQPVPTDNPTTQPTPGPTKKPRNPKPISSPVETDQPTQNPQATLTDNPTEQPTTEPTKQPRNPKPFSLPSETDQPTKNPQPTLTDKPTAPPTSSPTKGPIEKPLTPKPISSVVETDQPTKNPQPVRTNEPTGQPTKAPVPSTFTPTGTTELAGKVSQSPAPTKDSSTRMQTVSPSGSSIESFTSSSPITPTTKRNPTLAENTSPFLKESQKNSTELTTQPITNDSTPSPSRQPRKVPTRDLTEKPLPTPLQITVATNRPTVPPTKTTMPSRRPSFAPTLVLQVSPVITNVVMKFDDCQKLQNSSIAVWRRVTTGFVADSMSANLHNSGMQFSDLRVIISYKTQLGPWNFPQNSTNSTTVGNSRYLQTRLSPLNLFFDVLIKLRSTNHQHDWQSYFIDTLNTKDKLVAYLKQLSASGDDAFGSINNVTVEINGQSIAQVQRIPESLVRKSLGGTGLILVCASAAAAVAALSGIMFIIFRRKQAANPNKEHNAQGDRLASIDDDIFIEIEQKMDDVSTLGNIYGVGDGSEQKFEDPTVGESTIKCNTVYQNLIGTADHKDKGPSMNPYSSVTEDDIVISQEGVESSPPFQGSKTKRKKSIYSEDTQQEKTAKTVLRKDSESVCYAEPSETEIEVNAPPGKLGVLIDSDKRGKLKVNSVKSSSPLLGLILVGDILKSVDGESTSGLTADQASNLITSKAGNHNRVLVFVRKVKTSKDSTTVVN